ncbi:MAG: metal ABC transporter permease [Candidatus Goldiibacteriota bacterium]
MVEDIFLRTLIVTSLAGLQCGLIGVFIFLLSIPFIGVAVSHAAMAGGIWGIIFGLPPKICALAVSMASAFFIGPLADKGGVNTNISVSIIFSAMMGLAFLGIGIIGDTGTEVMSYLWGNVFLVSEAEIMLLSLSVAVIIIFTAVMYRAITAVLFSREMARANGVNEKFIYYAILIFTGAVVSINLDIIGGLMLFSLIITPPAIAHQLTFGMKKFFVISGISGIAAGAGGVVVSYIFDWPVSASVILFVSAMFMTAVIFSPKRRKYGA